MALSLTLIVPDIHVPIHDPEAVACVLKVARLLKPRLVLFLGDMLECPQFSRHDKKALTEDQQTEWGEDMDTFDRVVLTPLEKWSRERVIVEGNHEYRVEAAALRNKEIRLVYRDISPRVRFGKRKRMTYVPYSEPLSHFAIAPTLWAVHGWSFSEHAEAQHLKLASSFSIWNGHTHRIQCASKRDPATQRLLRAMSPGFLGTLQPVWHGANPTNWAHGFGLTWADAARDEHWSYICEIDRGVTVLPDGRRISA
jgi:hypothetical protein